MFSHVMLGVNDLETSKEIYDALLGTLGIAPRVSLRRYGPALPGLPARPGRQQNLRAAPPLQIGREGTSHRPLSFFELA